jgi:hypothetical protein
VSLQDSRPLCDGTTSAIVHQFGSRPILQHQEAATHLKAIMDYFTENIAQPLSSEHSESRRMGFNYVEPPSPTPNCLRPTEDLTQRLSGMKLAEKVELTNRSNSSQSFTRKSKAVDSALRFRSVVEAAFERLQLAEDVVLKLKLISLMKDEEEWEALFVELGLSVDVASLVALLMKSA